MARIRNLLDDYRIAAAAHEPTDRAVGFLVADVERMDRHLSNGGDLPAAWGREQATPFPVYSVDDPDPTPALVIARCYAVAGDRSCTWAKDHDHPQHVSGDGMRVVAVWPR
jgi:hypothetical protein